MKSIQFAQMYQDILDQVKDHSFHPAIEDTAGMIALARYEDNLKYILLGKYLLGICYYNLYDYRNSIEKYLEIMNQVLDSSLDLDALDIKPGFLDQVRYGMAVNMYYLGDLDGASIILTYILENSMQMDIVLDSVILLGVVYLMMYDLNKNISYLILTLEMYVALLEETILPRPKKAMVHNNLALLFYQQGEYQKAQERLNDAFVQVTTPAELIAIFNEMAHIHLELKNLDKVRKNLEKGKEYLNSYVHLAEESQHYLLWGILRKAEDNFTEAQRMMEKSFFLAKFSNNRLQQIRACRELAVLYERMGHMRDSEFFLEYKELKDGVNPVKEVIKWEEIWQNIKDRGSQTLIPIQKNKL